MDRESMIQEVLNRGVENIYPSKDYLYSRLTKGEPLKIYLGIDPTGPTLHLGHIIPLIKLSQLQKLGHKIILLIGDFTATIGDPTGKMSARIPLTHKEVLKNAKLYKKQAQAILNFSGENPAEIKYNSKWLKKLSLADMANLLSNVTYAQTIKRDMFQKRIEEGKDLYLNEFLYPVLQGYDSVAMAVDGEIGGNDQTFNMLMGRDFLKKLISKEKFVISMKLLTDSAGTKMGKTEGNMVALTDKPKDMFGKVMSWPDAMIIPAFELCTKTPMHIIEVVKKSLSSGANPKDAKMKLAETIVSMYFGDKKAAAVKEEFSKTFSKGETPQDIKEHKATAGALLVDCLLSAGIIASKSEWRRLVGENAVSQIFDDNKSEKIMDFNFKVEKTSVFKIGKHRFLKVLV